MPMVVFYIPTMDLAKLQGRITDSGNIIVNRAFQPREGGLVLHTGIPTDNDRRGFDHIEKIMDEDLEDEMALEYQASPMLREFKKMKTPSRLMQLLCDMPSGPHNAEKERLLRELATAIDYHQCWQSSSHAIVSGLLPSYSILFLKVLYMLVTVHLAWEVQKD